MYAELPPSLSLQLTPFKYVYCYGLSPAIPSSTAPLLERPLAAVPDSDSSLSFLQAAPSILSSPSPPQLLGHVLTPPIYVYTKTTDKVKLATSKYKHTNSSSHDVSCTVVIDAFMNC